MQIDSVLCHSRKTPECARGDRISTIAHLDRVDGCLGRLSNLSLREEKLPNDSYIQVFELIEISNDRS